MWWLRIFIYLKLIDISNILFVSKSLNEVVNAYKQFEDHCNLARTVINTIELNKCFMKYFDKLIIKICGQFTFNTTLYLRYSLVPDQTMTVGTAVDILLPVALAPAGATLDQTFTLPGGLSVVVATTGLPSNFSPLRAFRFRITGTPTTAVENFAASVTFTDDLLSTSDTETFAITVESDAPPVIPVPQMTGGYTGIGTAALVFADPELSDITAIEFRSRHEHPGNAGFIDTHWGQESLDTQLGAWVPIARSSWGPQRQVTLSATNSYALAAEFRFAIDAQKGTATRLRRGLMVSSTTLVGSVADQTLTVGVEVTILLPVAITVFGEGLDSVTPTLPDGLSVRNATSLIPSTFGNALETTRREIHGTPTTAVENFAASVVYTSEDGTSATASFAITVEEAVPTAPSFGDATQDDITLIIGTFFQQTLVRATEGAPVTSYSITPGTSTIPGVSAFDTPSGLLLFGTPSAAYGPVTHTLTATSASGETATLTFSITITSAPEPEDSGAFSSAFDEGFG